MQQNHAHRRIAFLVEDLEVGGAQRHTALLANGLPGWFEPRLISFASDVSPGIVPDGIKQSVVKLDLRGGRDWFQIGKAVAREEPALVVAVNQIATIAAIAAKTIGVIRSPVISVFHSTEIKSRAGWARTLPYFPAVWLSDGVVFVSRNQHAYWRRRGLTARRVAAIRNGISTEGLEPPSLGERAAARAQLGFSGDDLVIGCLAALRYEKNHVQLIDAIASLRARGIVAKALLVGDGPKRGEIEARIAVHGLGNHVLLAGQQRDVRPFIAAMDVGALTSLSIETLSLAALETMAMGVPMVMSEIGGASEVVSPGVDGYLYPAGDTAALVDRIAKCADAAHRRALGTRAAEKVRLEFDHAKMCESYADFFRDVVAMSGKRRA